VSDYVLAAFYDELEKIALSQKTISRAIQGRAQTHAYWAAKTL
jgi:hypothetical protein